jgi:hypothetical protein
MRVATLRWILGAVTTAMMLGAVTAIIWQEESVRNTVATPAKIVPHIPATPSERSLPSIKTLPPLKNQTPFIPMKPKSPIVTVNYIFGDAPFPCCVYGMRTPIPLAASEPNPLVLFGAAVGSFVGVRIFWPMVSAHKDGKGK